MATTLVRKVMLKIAADDGDTEAKLDKIQAKADQLARDHPELTPRINTAAASAKLAVLRKELKDTQNQGDQSGVSLKGLGGALSDLVTGGLSGGIGEMTMFQKVMMGVNFATGLGEPAVAGLTVAVGGLASGLAAGGLGLGAFGLVAKGVYSQVSTAVQAFQTAQSTTGKASATAMAQYKAYMAALPASQQGVARSIIGAENAWQGFVQSNTGGVAKIMSQGIGLLPKVFSALQPFLAPTEKALGGLVGELGKGLGSSGFKDWIGAFAKASGPNITNLGHAIGHIAVGIGGILKAFLPMSTTMTGGLDKLTAKFAQWGTTLTKHSGFQSLMQMAKQDAPLLGQVLKNVGAAVKNLGSDMAGLSTFSNSKTLLQLAGPLSGLLKALSGHPDLVNLGLWGMTAYAGLNKAKLGLSAVKDGLGSIKGGVDNIKNLASGFSSAEQAAAAETGAWGTIGGKLSTAVTAVKNWGIWSKIAAGATKVWTGVQAAFNVVMDMNPIALIVIGIAALIAIIVICVVKFKSFRDFWKDAWHDISHVFDIVRHDIAHGFDLITGAAAKAFGWVKQHWPLLLAIITGPIGLATLWVVRHWDQITAGARRMGNDVISFFRGLPHRILSAVGDLGHLLWNAGVNVIKGLIGGVTSMIGGIGNAMGGIASKIRSFLPFSPAKEGPLSGGGSPDIAGRKIGLMLGAGMEASTSMVSASAARVARAAQIGAAAHPVLAGAGAGGHFTFEVVGDSNQVLTTLLKRNIRLRGGNPGVLGR